MTVCTTFRKDLIRTSPSKSASRMGAGKKKRMSRPAKKNVFLISSGKSRSVNSRTKLSKPTQGHDERIVPLKRNEQPEHGNIFENQKIQESRQNH